MEIAARSDPGRDPSKQVNEDAFGERATALGHLAFVCDGMGGHEGGREASALAAQTILEWFASAAPGGSPRDVLRGAIEEANRRVFRLGKPGGAGMQNHAGSTCVAVLVHAGGTEVAHVGDSRAFLLHAGQIFQITRDHSMVQQMVDAQLLTPEQAARHPDANKITRALGIAPDVEVELRAQPLVHAPGDTFILCSDGLTDMVTAEEIAGIVQASPYARAASDLVDLANARGGHDNITVVLARAREGVAPARLPLALATATANAAATATANESVPAPTKAATKTLVGAPLPLPPGSSSPPYAGPGSVRFPVPPAPRLPVHAVGHEVDAPAPRVNRLLVAVGVLVTLLAMGGAGVLVYLHLADRNGSHHDHDLLDGGTLSVGGPAREPVSLVPTRLDGGAEAGIVSGSSASGIPPVSRPPVTTVPVPGAVPGAAPGAIPSPGSSPSSNAPNAPNAPVRRPRP